MKIRVDFEPVAKSRPRVMQKGGKRWVYTDPKVTEAQNNILLISKSCGLEPFADRVPLKFTATFYRCKPENKNGKMPCPALKPDIDNYIKTVLDALDGTILPNDSQVVSMDVCKKWTDKPDNIGYIEFELSEYKPEIEPDMIIPKED
jgi:Holliday junction resolvase RusA-like endonuclease